MKITIIIIIIISGLKTNSVRLLVALRTSQLTLTKKKKGKKKKKKKDNKKS